MIVATIALSLLAIGSVSASPAIADRIVNGDSAVLGQFPYQASLRDSASDRHNCGGSIIRSNWILTASHCLEAGFNPITQTVIPPRPNEIFVVIAAVRIRGQGIAHNVSQIVLHSNYNPANLLNDIALLRLTVQIQFNRLARPISIGNGAHVPAGVVARASGWGLLSFLGAQPDTLQYLDVTTLTNIDCRARSQIPHFVHDSTVCVRGNRAASGICQGDSGGPLVSDGVLIGVTSWAFRCGSGHPDGFVRVSSFRTWILRHIGN